MSGQAQQAVRRCAIVRRQPARFDKIGSRHAETTSGFIHGRDKGVKPARVMARQRMRGKILGCLQHQSQQVAAPQLGANAHVRERIVGRLRVPLPDVEPRFEVRP